MYYVYILVFCDCDWLRYSSTIRGERWILVSSVRNLFGMFIYLHSVIGWFNERHLSFPHRFRIFGWKLKSPLEQTNISIRFHFQYVSTLSHHNRYDIWLMNGFSSISFDLINFLEQWIQWVGDQLIRKQC